MKNPLVSIVVPVYNVELYLSRCIDSIITQSYDTIEIILVDDGSQDNCPCICDDYAVKDSRIRVIHKLNGGLSDARNAGLERINGQYVAFVDSDDFLNKYYIEKLYTALITNNADVAICNFQKVDGNYNKLVSNSEYIQFIGNSKIIWNEEAFWNAYFSGYTPCNVVWSKLYKSSIFDNIRFTREKIHEDEFILHQIISKCTKIIPINDILYFYLQRDNSIIAGIKNSTNFDLLEAFQDRYNYFMEKEYYVFAEKTIVLMQRFCRIKNDTVKRMIKQCYKSIKVLSKTFSNSKSFKYIIITKIFNLNFNFYCLLHSIFKKN